MTTMDGPQVVLLEGETTNTRVWLVDGEQVVAEALTAVGARDTARDGSPKRLEGALHSLVSGVRDEGEALPVPCRPSIVVAAGNAEVVARLAGDRSRARASGRSGTGGARRATHVSGGHRPPRAAGAGGAFGPLGLRARLDRIGGRHPWRGDDHRAVSPRLAAGGRYRPQPRVALEGDPRRSRRADHVERHEPGRRVDRRRHSANDLGRVAAAPVAVGLRRGLGRRGRAFRPGTRVLVTGHPALAHAFAEQLRGTSVDALPVSETQVAHAVRTGMLQVLARSAFAPVRAGARQRMRVVTSTTTGAADTAASTNTMQGDAYPVGGARAQTSTQRRRRSRNS
jgi:hypothetical protein